MPTTYELGRAIISTFVLDFAEYITGKVLDAGCGEKPFKRAFPNTEWVGLDVRPVGEIQADLSEKLLMIEDESFDTVLCTDVLQFILEPLGTIREFARILKPGGYLLLIAPGYMPLSFDELCSLRPQGLAYMCAELKLEVVDIEGRGTWFRGKGKDFLSSVPTGMPIATSEFLGFMDYLDKNFPAFIGLVAKK